MFILVGPSYGLRNGCASGLLALDRAVTSIRQGDCDTAIVVGCNLCLKPSSSVQLSEMSLLSPDGKCRCFDVEGGKGHAKKRDYLKVIYLNGQKHYFLTSNILFSLNFEIDCFAHLAEQQVSYYHQLASVIIIQKSLLKLLSVFEYLSMIVH